MYHLLTSAVALMTVRYVIAAPHIVRQASGLNTAAKAAEKLYFGSATDNPELRDTAYVNELSNIADFGQITPGNSMKWDAIEPSQNTFTYTQGDAIASLAAKNSQLLRCHNLRHLDKCNLYCCSENHITKEVTHYKGKCYAWDVVNEALNDDGTYRTNVFYSIIGPQYIPIAFSAAAAADPAVKLYYNDYNIESPGAKATAAQNIIKMMKA
ncbi:hypothetical protein MMC14_007792 [Varicellaria rhodocarpa]|nr:hypothetical protein [Varicellaria rhodocarpa]